MRVRIGSRKDGSRQPVAGNGQAASGTHAGTTLQWNMRVESPRPSCAEPYGKYPVAFRLPATGSRLPALPYLIALTLSACAPATKNDSASGPFFGTQEPFASESIYFVVADRFVNGDPSNDQREQGGKFRTFDIPVPGPDGQTDNIG